MTGIDARLEIYKITVEMADRLSARRSTANAFFLSLEAALTTSLGVIHKGHVADSMRLSALFGALALALTLIWWFQLTSYRNISEAKFQVIHAMELELPADPYTKEWEYIQVGRGKSLIKHFDLTKIERLVPLFFLAIDALMIFTGGK